MLTMSLEDYLETILLLTRDQNGTRVRDIATFLDVKMPSVNKAISELKKMDYVSQEPYGAVTLTEEGKICADKILQRHRLLKHFLKILDVSDENAESDACRIEHFLSRETISCITRFVEAHQEQMDKDEEETDKTYPIIKNRDTLPTD